MLYGLEADDIKAAIMGMTGLDIIFTPAARKFFNFDIEAKNRETLAVHPTFTTHYEKYKHRDTVKLLIHKKNRALTLVTLDFDDFMKMVDELLVYRHGQRTTIDMQPASVQPQMILFDKEEFVVGSH